MQIGTKSGREARKQRLRQMAVEGLEAQRSLELDAAACAVPVVESLAAVGRLMRQPRGFLAIPKVLGQSAAKIIP